MYDKEYDKFINAMCKRLSEDAYFSGVKTKEELKQFLDDDKAFNKFASGSDYRKAESIFLKLKLKYDN